MFPQRFEIAPRFLQAHFEPTDRICLALLRRGESIKHEFMSAKDAASPRVQAHLRAANAHGADVYFGVNTIEDGARSRTKADIAQVKHLFCDIDQNGVEVVKRILASELPKPSVILETSPNKFQILWRVTGFTKDQAEDGVRAIAHRFGADTAVWDCARVLRLPGFANRKPALDRPFFVRAVPGHRSTGVLTPSAFPDFPSIERGHAQTGRTVNGQSNGQRNGQSPSEKDWAWVLRALETGASAREVEARLEGMSGRKANPKQYSELTVEKAVQYLDRKRGSHACSIRR